MSEKNVTIFRDKEKHMASGQAASGNTASDAAASKAAAATAVATTAEILAFYTSVMRGEEDEASVTNRITAADKLLQQNESAGASTASVERLDILIGELRRAIEDGSFVAEDGNEEDAVQEELIAEDAESEDDDEDWEEDGDEDQ